MTGSVRMAGDLGRSVTVRIHLDEETLSLLADDGADLGTWPLDRVVISSKHDGFHLRIEGEEVILNTSDDARFALAIGINTPTSRLARQMARLRDETTAIDLTEDAVVVPQLPSEMWPSPRRHSRLANGLPYLGPLVIASAVIAFFASVVAAGAGSAISFPGNIPAWPAMMAAALVMAAGGFSAYQNTDQGRLSIGGGLVLGLIAILMTAGRLVETGAVEEAMLAFTLAVVASGVLLAIDTGGRNTVD